MKKTEHYQVFFGRHPVAEALRARKRGFKRVLIYRKSRGEIIDEIISLAKKVGVPVDWVDNKSVLEQWLKPGEAHQGVVLLAGVREQAGSWKSILNKVTGKKEGLVVFGDRIADPGNLGAIVRVACAFGADGLVISKARSAPLDSRVLKASVGLMDWIEIAQVNNFTEVIRQFQKKGVWLMGLAAEGSKSLWEVDFRGAPWAVVVGSEGQGIRRVIRDLCDVTACIPMAREVDSLNVSVACGVGLYEIVRQRRSALSG